MIFCDGVNYVEIFLQLNNRDKEIQRLTALLEGGRPLPALNKDCCYKDMVAKLNSFSEEISLLHTKNHELDLQLAGKEYNF